MADVVLDHPSLSRQHAAVCYHETSRCWVFLDLNSAHGTAVDGRQVPKASVQCQTLLQKSHRVWSSIMC